MVTGRCFIRTDDGQLIGPFDSRDDLRAHVEAIRKLLPLDETVYDEVDEVDDLDYDDTISPEEDLANATAWAQPNQTTN